MIAGLGGNSPFNEKFEGTRRRAAEKKGEGPRAASWGGLPEYTQKKGTMVSIGLGANSTRTATRSHENDHRIKVDTPSIPGKGGRTDRAQKKDSH